METATIVIIVFAVLLPLVITFVVLRSVRGMMGGSKKQKAEAQRLLQTGSKARAMILSIQPTGMVVNNINIQCVVGFQIEPLDGAAAFSGEKKMLINQTQMPRAGDVWPCWYDPADPTLFAVGQPDGASPDQLPVFREFGIPHPLDPSTGGAASSPSPAAPAGGAAPDPAGDRVDDLERLADMRSRGLLTDTEFEAEKKRLLES